ncbi:uncharacterized protein (TIGR03790 family) [Desulfoprunum benzoelyticum]|uniref:Uncharacterized protein (TIGR03790 family) n=1 Tax=Desulfoprunum benzoelyticum TaxID=1506996 RepID=A0A840UZT3_9BACT|nr:TIGR03790 family protein [Desulfoprunum benzoelyticum]MBB5346969.1 uncharacterized protein (TIGR03790 family) [Desulfoprunum benzoelyticum]
MITLYSRQVTMKNFCRLVFLISVLVPTTVVALEPAEVVVVANRFIGEGVDLARYYMEKRGIPRENLVKINTTEKEFCSREVYDEEIAKPVRKFLRKRTGHLPVRCLVTMFGVPLKVEPPALDKAEKKQLTQLQTEQNDIRTQLREIDDQKSPTAVDLNGKIAVLDRKIRTIGKKEYRAAVDSELALVLAEIYPLDGWVVNPFFLGAAGQLLPVSKDEVLMIARLDGPTEQVVRRIIDDSLATETATLIGTAYFDARWKQPEKQESLTGYAFYDNSIHQAAAGVKASRRLPVIVDDRQTLFQPGEAPGAALYCGWYSLSRYVDAFDWQRGAVGYHIASGECGTLRPGSSQAWCKRMLEDGVAATLGPVGEPYVQAFPSPEAFFGLLMDGSHTLVESYFFSLPFLSWQMVLVGDPLYRPFPRRQE